ncbi:MAG: phosphatidylglycerophosphatase A [Chitinophagaceae bacterium]
MSLLKIIATCSGIGYIKGGGTIAATVFTLLWYFIPFLHNNLPVQVVLFVVISAVGVFASNKLEAVWGKDSGKIVIDEVAGMGCTLLFVPHTWQFALAGLIAFRFFDIVKPFFITSAEKLPAGWGVMADDIAAGICANIVLQLLVLLNVF